MSVFNSEILEVFLILFNSQTKISEILANKIKLLYFWRFKGLS